MAGPRRQVKIWIQSFSADSGLRHASKVHPKAFFSINSRDLLGTAGMLAVFWFQKGQLDSTLPLIPFMFSILVQQIGAREDLPQKARLVNAITLTIFAIACEIFYQAAIGTDIPTAYVLYPIMMAITLWAETACRWLDRAEQHNSNIVKVIAIAIFVTGIGIGIYAMYLKSI